MEQNPNGREITVVQTTSANCEIDWIFDIYLDKVMYSKYLTEEEKEQAGCRFIEIGKYYNTVLNNVLITLRYDQIYDEQNRKVFREVSTLQGSFTPIKVLQANILRETISNKSVVSYIYRQLYPNDKPDRFYRQEAATHKTVLNQCCELFKEHIKLKSPENRAYASICVKKPLKDIFKFVSDFENYSHLGFCDTSKMFGEGGVGTVVEFKWEGELTVSFEVTKKEICKKGGLIELTYKNRNEKKIKRTDYYRVLPISRRKSFLMAEIIINNARKGKIDSLNLNLKKMLSNIKKLA